MQKISYVIPCYRSQRTVGGVVAEIAATMQTLPQYDYEVILVNDCSPDDTFGTIRSLVAADSHVVAVDNFLNAFLIFVVYKSPYINRSGKEPYTISIR